MGHRHKSDWPQVARSVEVETLLHNEREKEYKVWQNAMFWDVAACSVRELY